MESPYQQPKYLDIPHSPKQKKEASALCLELNCVIGITTCSPLGFSYLPSSNLFAYCAGASAVVAKIENGNTFSRKYFRHPSHGAIDSNLRFAKASPKHLQAHHQPLRSYRGDFAGELTHARSPNLKRKLEMCSNSRQQRARKINCLSLSSDGKLLAVGEVAWNWGPSIEFAANWFQTGHDPRIMIFSITTANPPFLPQCSLSEHSFSVSGLAFSPDGRWLCSVGDYKDGFVHLWDVENTANVKLYASNKCSTAIRGLTWLGGSIVTIGTRHVKVWRPHHKFGVSPLKQNLKHTSIEANIAASPGPKPLVGRNCILGPLADAIFTCICPVSDCKAVICTEGGGICFLEEDGQTSTVSLIGSTSFGISCCAFDQERHLIWIGGIRGESSLYSLRRGLSSSNPYKDSPTPFELQLQTKYESGLIAGGISSQCLVTIEKNHSINVYSSMFHKAAVASRMDEKTSKSHQHTILGIHVLSTSHGDAPKILTWSAEGNIMIWSLAGLLHQTQHIELRCTKPRVGPKLRVLELVSHQKIIVSGDNAGVVRVTENMYDYHLDTAKKCLQV